MSIQLFKGEMHDSFFLTKALSAYEVASISEISKQSYLPQSN